MTRADLPIGRPRTAHDRTILVQCGREQVRKSDGTARRRPSRLHQEAGTESRPPAWGKDRPALGECASPGGPAFQEGLGRSLALPNSIPFLRGGSYVAPRPADVGLLERRPHASRSSPVSSYPNRQQEIRSSLPSRAGLRGTLLPSPDYIEVPLPGSRAGYRSPAAPTPGPWTAPRADAGGRANGVHSDAGSARGKVGAGSGLARQQSSARQSVDHGHIEPIVSPEAPSPLQLIIRIPDPASQRDVIAVAHRIPRRHQDRGQRR
jgi:hypothetical protein